VRITDIKTRLLKPMEVEELWRPGFSSPFDPVVVSILTDEGVSGDCITVFCGAYQADQFAVVRNALVGKDPHYVEALWRETKEALAARWMLRQPAIVSSTIDICLWDLLAKKAGLPLYKYLGAYRDRIRAYASIVTYQEGGKVAFETDRDFVEEALRCVKEGFTAFKIHPYFDAEPDMRLCRAVREAVGDKVDLMHDPVCAYSRRDAFRVGRLLEELRFFWYEDPIPVSDVQGLRDLCLALDIPIAVGETLYGGVDSYPTYLSSGAGDIMRIIGDMAGGITTTMKLAHMCEGFGVNCEIHSFGSTLAQAAMLHAMLAVKNCDFFELPVPTGIFDVAMKDTIRVAKDGFIYAPTKPGLGYDIDWDEVDRLTVREI